VPSDGRWLADLAATLDNGQVDEYADRDTVRTSDALRIVSHLVSEGVPPDDASWEVDR
jgi:hypothetical protein